MTLAFVVFTVLSPSDMRGIQFETLHPVECVKSIDIGVAEFAAHGVEVMAQCRYTQAPEQSSPPRLR